MSRLPLRAGLAVLALASLVTAGPASADDVEYTAVGFAVPGAAYINAVYRPAVAEAGRLLHEVIDAECEFSATGAGSNVGGAGEEETEQAVFVAKVVTTYAKQDTANPVDGLPAATGIVCSVWDDVELVRTTDVLRSGNFAYNAFLVDVEGVQQPRICVRAYVIFGDTSRVDGPETCK